MFAGSRVIGGCAAAAAVVGLTASLGPAAATPPVAGAHYKGITVGGTPEMDQISFNVSADGHRVTKVRAGAWPISKCGAGGAKPAQTSKPARVREGRLTAHVVFRSANGEPLARATVKGTFLRHGKEKGTVSTVYVDDPCDVVTTVSYTTRAQ